MNLINTVTLEYPRSLWQLRQANPNVSFPVNPTDDDLAPFDHANVHPTPQPSCDPRTERTEHNATLTADGWQQAWIIRPATDEEIATYDLANSPQPEWMEFGIDLAMHPGVTALYNAIPGPVAGGLTVGLNEAGKGDPRLFAGLWGRLMAAGAVSAELLADIAALAAQHNLPPEFIAGLAGAGASQTDLAQ